MKRILKYTVPWSTDSPTMVAEIDMPRGARILSTAAQDGNIRVWALTDHVQALSETRRVQVLGTGWQVPEDALDGYDFLGTVLIGELVWHVWVWPSNWSQS